jgi:hypothetical protein
MAFEATSVLSRQRLRMAAGLPGHGPRRFSHGAWCGAERTGYGFAELAGNTAGMPLASSRVMLARPLLGGGNSAGMPYQRFTPAIWREGKIVFA